MHLRYHFVVCGQSHSAVPNQCRMRRLESLDESILYTSTVPTVLYCFNEIVGCLYYVGVGGDAVTSNDMRSLMHA